MSTLEQWHRIASLVELRELGHIDSRQAEAVPLFSLGGGGIQADVTPDLEHLMRSHFDVPSFLSRIMVSFSEQSLVQQRRLSVAGELMSSSSRKSIKSST
jgi:hypothetical protein